jgi:hypothetical protein
MDHTNPDDWRLCGQERYLKGKAFRWTRYIAPRPTWDHDHCEFCWAKFMETDLPDVLHEGYCSEEFRWICRTCFEDFRAQFEWRVDPSN